MLCSQDDWQAYKRRKGDPFYGEAICTELAESRRRTKLVYLFL